MSEPCQGGTARHAGQFEVPFLYDMMREETDRLVDHWPSKWRMVASTSSCWTWNEIPLHFIVWYDGKKESNHIDRCRLLLWVKGDWPVLTASIDISAKKRGSLKKWHLIVAFFAYSLYPCIDVQNGIEDKAFGFSWRRSKEVVYLLGANIFISFEVMKIAFGVSISNTAARQRHATAFCGPVIARERWMNCRRFNLHGQRLSVLKISCGKLGYNFFPWDIIIFKLCVTQFFNLSSSIRKEMKYPVSRPVRHERYETTNDTNVSRDSKKLLLSLQVSEGRTSRTSVRGRRALSTWRNKQRGRSSSTYLWTRRGWRSQRMLWTGEWNFHHDLLVDYKRLNGFETREEIPIRLLPTWPWELGQRIGQETIRTIK